MLVWESRRLPHITRGVAWDVFSKHSLMYRPNKALLVVTSDLAQPGRTFWNSEAALDPAARVLLMALNFALSDSD